VLLVGDAAHASPPNMAQGAAMSFEDALVLAELLSAAPLTEALAQYERLRVLLRDELGVSPSPALREAWAGLLR
jgi:2-polyprenyl-6-methoxyphenol hydroxylase-like FAD-dependent oxidoreductase